MSVVKIHIKRHGQAREAENQPICRPPLSEKSAPVAKPASSEASQATMDPISPGVPSRRTGIVLTIFSSTSGRIARTMRSEEHTSELQSLMRISYAVFCLKKKKSKQFNQKTNNT